MAGPDHDHRLGIPDCSAIETGETAHSSLDGPLRSTLHDLLPLDGSVWPSVEERISEILIGYDCSFLIQQMSGKPKEQKTKLAKLSTALETAVDALLALPPDYNVAIATLASRGMRSDSIDTIRLETEMLLLRLGAQRFLRAFEPSKGRPNHYALEEAVRSLLQLIETELGIEVGIRWNKEKDKPPEAGTDGAKAIEAVLRRTCPQPSVTAILNMIDKVQKSPLEETPSPFDPVIRAHADELDASLLPGREERNASGLH